jgi:hypothetical protein
MNSRTKEIEDFFKNYFTTIHENYDNENYNKIQHEIEFMKNLFDDIQFHTPNAMNMRFHYYLPRSSFYDDFNNYCLKSLNNSLYSIGMYFDNNVFFELFKILKKIILYKYEKINENIFNEFINMYEINKSNLHNYQTFSIHLINNMLQRIYKQSINNLIINILNIYLENYEEFITIKKYNNLLNEKIYSIKFKTYYDENKHPLNTHTMLDFKDFNKEITIHNLSSFTIWSCYGTTHQYYNDAFEMFLNHYNFLNDLLIMKNNAKQNTTKNKIQQPEKETLQKEITNIIKEKNIKKNIKKDETKIKKEKLINEKEIDKKKIKKTIKKEIDEKKIKKKTIPPSLKIKVWNKHIGDEIGKTKCLCCKLQDIYQASFSCGHIISEHFGGELKLNNLKPICSSCNSSMGTKNMDDYIKEYGF